MQYNVKTVVAGNYAEQTEYPSNRWKGYTISDLGQKRKHGERRKTVVNKTRLKKNVKRARDKIRYLIHANTKAVKPLFLTNTYAENEQRRHVAQEDVRKFTRLLRKKVPNVQYLYVFEKQKRGAYHVHMVIFGVHFISWEELQSMWPKGSIKIKKHKWSRNTGNYMGKYIGKEENNIRNVRLYSRSRNLEKENLDFGMNSLLDCYTWVLEKKKMYSTINGLYILKQFRYAQN